MAECECPPCPGRGNDGHGMTHCAECCFGSGVIPDLDCPIHGQPEPNDEQYPTPGQEWCNTHHMWVPVVDAFDDQIGYEEQARPVHVVALDCGHDIVRRLKSWPS